MANTFTLSATGYTSVTLSGSPILAINYSLGPSDPQYEPIESPGDNADITDPRLTAVTGSLRLMITSTTEAGVQAHVRNINIILDAARRWRKTGVKAYLTVQLGNESTAWRTQILAGRLDTPRIADQLHLKKVDAVLAITRVYYFEGPETQLDLSTSANGTPTSEPTFYVNDDATASQTNWIQIAASEVEGDMPSPLKLKLKNTSGVSLNWRDFYIAHNVHSDPANFDPFLLGSESDDGASDSWGAGANGTNLYQFSPTILTAARLADLGGRMFRMIAVFTSLTVNGLAYFTLHVAHVVGSTYTSVWSSGEVAVSSADIAKYEVLDFGSMPVPAGGFTGAGGQVGIFMEVRAVNSGSCVLDFIQMSPTDSFRKIVKSGFGNPNGESLVDDGIDGLVYTEDASSKQFPVWTPLGKPIFAHPGKLQRLYVIQKESGGWTAGRQMSARAFYRPRRSTV